jgi:hypothetical protein
LATLQPVVISFRFSDESQTLSAKSDGVVPSNTISVMCLKGEEFIKATQPVQEPAYPVNLIGGMDET